MVLILVASLNENVKLANRVKNSLEFQNIDCKIVNLVDLDLPLYDSFKEQNSGIPQKALELANEMEKAKAYIFVSPEYNFCVTPVLVNTIAWISRAKEDFRILFSMKKIQLATHSGISGENALNSLRIMFTKLGAIIMPREIIETPKKELKDESLNRILSQFVSFIKE